MASTISLRTRVLTGVCDLAIFFNGNLHQFVVFSQCCDLLCGQPKETTCQDSQFLQFGGIDIAPLVLGKPEQEDCPIAALYGDDR